MKYRFSFRFSCLHPVNTYLVPFFFQFYSYGLPIFWFQCGIEIRLLNRLLDYVHCCFSTIQFTTSTADTDHVLRQMPKSLPFWRYLYPHKLLFKLELDCITVQNTCCPFLWENYLLLPHWHHIWSFNLLCPVECEERYVWLLREVIVWF